MLPLSGLLPGKKEATSSQEIVDQLGLVSFA